MPCGPNDEHGWVIPERHIPLFPLALLVNETKLDEVEISIPKGL